MKTGPNDLNRVYIGRLQFKARLEILSRYWRMNIKYFIMFISILLTKIKYTSTVYFDKGILKWLVLYNVYLFAYESTSA